MAKKKAAKKASKKQIEQYAHPDKRRANNPPVGLVTPATDPPDPPKKTYQYDPHLDPQLVWAGKAERTSFEVPTVSLHVHERIDPKTIIKAVRSNGDGAAHASSGKGPKRQLSLFEEPEQNPPLRDALDFYKHPHGWTNRMIAGDSLLVMNSLLEKEGLAGKVQMIYIDPPYGIRYGSNFQPFVNNREVRDADDDLTQEPEMIKAFRDTWEVGIHSYLSYLRDRLFLARDLLHESGSIFVQISDENLHHVREMLDEVFGVQCRVVDFVVKKKGSQKSGLIDPVNDYLLWYGRSPRNSGAIRFRSLFATREIDSETLAEFRNVELADGSTYNIAKAPTPDGETFDYRLSPRRLFQDYPAARVFRSWPITNGGTRTNQMDPVDFEGNSFHPPSGRCWSFRSRLVGDESVTPMDRLRVAGRLCAARSSLDGKRYLDDFPYKAISNWWDGLGGASSPVYVVQTNPEIIARCMLMCTDPGDLVFDPTCGSGSTAFVAEQWGRRWITCDTSRVAVTLAKQRLMTAVFDYFKLAHPKEGVGSGFVYKTVPHVTLKSIANNPDIKEGMTREEIDAAIAKYADQETLYDQPQVDRSKARVSGPFTVEAVPAVTVVPIDEVDDVPVSDASVTRSGATSRQDEWRDELARTGIRGKGGQKISFARLEPQPGARHLHAIGETDDKQPKTVAVSFGPEHAPLEQRQVEQAWEEARSMTPRPEMLLFAAFHFDPEAAKDIDELDPQKTGMLFLRSQMNTDLLTDDLKKKRASNESFWLIGQPDVELRQLKKGEHKGLWQVEVRGFDYYNPNSGKIESGDTSKIAMWLLDTDYDGRSLYPRQVFFPMAGEKDGWSRLAKNLKAEVDEELIESYRGTVSLPFESGIHKRVAVKIVDDRGIESLKLVRVE